MLRLALAAALISLLAACSSTPQDTGASRAGATMGAPGDMNADYPPGVSRY